MDIRRRLSVRAVGGHLPAIFRGETRARDRCRHDRDLPRMLVEARKMGRPSCVLLVPSKARVTLSPHHLSRTTDENAQLAMAVDIHVN